MVNTLERRRMIKSRIIDISIAKTSVNASRRERAEAARKLRKALAASRYEAIKAETVSYPGAQVDRATG